MMGSSSGTGSGCVVDGPRDLGQVRFGQTRSGNSFMSYEIE